MALWFSEVATDGHRLEWKINKMLYSGRSPYQTIEVLDTDTFGSSLVLDGIMQTTTGDEFIYHEMLAWVPLSVHPHPERVLVIGGGDGGLVREVLGSSRVKHLDLVEIDPMVVEVSKKYLHRHVTAFEDPRLSLIIRDGMAYLQEPDIEPYDLILVDSTDPEGTGPGAVLYTPEFHQRVFSALNPDGIYVQQTGTPIYNPEVLSEASHSVAQIFPLCRVYWCAVPTYPGGFFTFTSGSKAIELAVPNPTLPRHRGDWYTPEMHVASFHLPPMIARLLPKPARLDQD